MISDELTILQLQKQKSYIINCLLIDIPSKQIELITFIIIPRQQYLQSEFKSIQFYSQLQKPQMEDAYTRERGSSEEGKLQRLWQELQDLSEVQDQSRNQQLPAFMNDDSRHLEHSSFVDTNHILNDSMDMQHMVNEPVNLFQIKYNHEQHTIKETQQNQINCHHSHNNYKYSQFYPYNRQSEYLINDTSQQGKTIKRQIKQGKTIQAQIKYESKIDEQSLEEVNQRLLSDNKKLFDQCIKLRKNLLLYEKKNKTTYETKKEQSIGVYHTSPLVSGNQQLFKQLQSTIKHQQATINHLLEQNTALKDKFSLNQAKFIDQKRQMTQSFSLREGKMKQQLQHDLQSKYKQKISSLQNLLNLKQRQVTEQKLSIKQAEFKISTTNKELIQYKRTTQKLQLQVKQYQTELQTLKNHVNQLKNQQHLDSVNKPTNINDQIQVNKQHALQKGQYSLINEKQSRATSIKSTSLSCNSSFNDKSHCFSVNQKTSNQNKNLQNTLKDKQRQITNIKIVHQAQVKNYKQIIEQLKLQLLHFGHQDNI